MKAVSAVTSFLRTIALLAMTGVLAFGSWLGYNTFTARDRAIQESREKDQKIKELNEEIDNQKRQIEKLDTAVRLLKVDHRVAMISVKEQRPGKDGQVSSTTFDFVETDAQGKPLDAPRTITIEGDLAYVDTYVIKFEDTNVESGDLLRGTSICLFHRIFGEKQNPSEGVKLDAVGSRPAAYSRGLPMSDFERQLWTNFWEYANDPEKAKAAGIRAAQGEAPSMKLKKDTIYRLDLRASDGLTIRPEKKPAGAGVL